MPEQNPKPPEATRALCQQFDRDLQAYLEGEDKPGVLTHARECVNCGVILTDLEQIRFVSRHIPLQEPPASVWANIRATLAEEGILHEQVPAWRRWFDRLPLIAEYVPVGALAGLALLALSLLTSPGVMEHEGAVASLPGGPEITASGVMPALIDARMSKTLQEMEQAYLGRRDSMEPVERETYRKTLASLDATIDECLKHCRRDPHNALARQYLARAYQSKAEVLASALEFSGE